MSETMQNASPEEIKKWAQRDLEAAISFLNMLRQDPEVLEAVMSIIVERIQVQQEASKKAPKLEFDGAR